MASTVFLEPHILNEWDFFWPWNGDRSGFGDAAVSLRTTSWSGQNGTEGFKIAAGEEQGWLSCGYHGYIPTAACPRLVTKAVTD